MSTLHALFRKEDIEPERLAGKIVVVVDILFATTTIACAFDAGTREIWPAADHDDALRIAAALGDTPLLAGEYLAEPLPGFAPSSPLLLSAQLRRGGTLVYCTTNGTVALQRCAGAAQVYAGALVNGAAVVAHIIRHHPGMPVLVICAGSNGRFCIEDLYGVGHIVSHFVAHPEYELNDSAQAALMLYRTHDPMAVLRVSRVGRRIHGSRHGNDLLYAAACDTLAVVPRVDGRRLIAAAGSSAGAPLPGRAMQTAAGPSRH